MTVTPDEDDRLLEVLAQLRDVGRRVNQLNLGDPAVLDATLRLIAESAVTIIPGATAILYTYDPARSSLDPVSRTSAGDHPALLRDATPRPDGLGMRAIRRTQPVLSYDEPDLDIHPDRRSAGAAAAACLPLLVAGQPLGALYVYLTEARRLSQLELLLLDNFVAQAAMALYLAGQVTHTRRNLARKEDELALLRHAGLLISSRTRLEETLVAILEMALEVTGARYGIFRLVDRSGQNLVMRAIAGERRGPACGRGRCPSTRRASWASWPRRASPSTSRTCAGLVAHLLPAGPLAPDARGAGRAAHRRAVGWKAC